MIIVKVTGGLGNQMFQYALYRVCKNNGVKAKLDINSFDRIVQHNGYEIERVFNLKADLATDYEIEKYQDNNMDILSKIIRKIGLRKRYFAETDFKYYPEIMNLKKGYLNGYWQSEKYFNSAKDIILNDYKCNFKENDVNLEVLKDIENTNSVSIHVRMGDYKSSENADRHFVIRDAKYYERAIERIKKSVDNPKFFIFSNDIQWVKENLPLDNSVIIDWNQGKDSYKDMFLMSKCKHNIIANSSFSWWGAWLNENKDKLVIAPDRWFNNIQAPDVICDSWIKVEVD